MNHRTLIRAALAAALFASISGCKHAETKKPVAEPAGAPDAPFRATRPAPSGELHFTPPKPDQMKLKNGLVVYTVERHDLPLVAVELVIKAGRDADPADKQGLAAFTADMLDEGAKGMDAPQIAASFEDLAIQYNENVESGVTAVGFNTLTQNLDQALTIFGNVVLHPTFTDKDLDRVRGERLAAYTAAHDDPAEIARDVLVRSLYGDKNPLGAPTVGTVEGIKALKKSDLSKFHDTWYVPSNAALVIVGDVKAADLKPMLEKHLGTWKDKKLKPVKLPEPPAAASRSVLFVDKPGAPQSQIWVGQLEFAAKDPDREAFTIMNDIFGGLFASRVNLALREGKGWSYGVYSFPMWTRYNSAWAVAGGFVADKSSDALGILTKLIDDLHAGEVTDAELSAARDAEVRSLSGFFESNGSTAGQLSRLIAEDLPIDYYSTVGAKLQAVTAADVKRVAQARLDPSKMTIVVVGPKAEQADKISALNVGKLDLRDESGKPAK
ncbi:MAG: insulinase family protein [Deltaproteobacteria bacterium]|nr:insulinase family protein [Deltaproteobacteria bacterium]